MITFVVYSATAYTIPKNIYKASRDNKSIIVREDQKIALKGMGLLRVGYLIGTVVIVLIYSLFKFNI